MEEGRQRNERKEEGREREWEPFFTNELWFGLRAKLDQPFHCYRQRVWVIVGVSLTHPFSGPCAKWRVSPAQRVLNYSSGVELCVIKQSRESWGSCDAQGA
jgi:hypothetical protein